MARKRLQDVMGDVKRAALTEEGDVETAPGNRFQKRMSLVGDVSNGRVSAQRRREVDPQRCRMWAHHNRLYDHLSAQNCSDLIDDIESAGGQKIPAIVREMRGEDGIDFEVIAGARRHFSVSHLRNDRGRDDIFFLVEIHDLTDEEAFRLSDLENRNREDISDYERAVDYAGALERYYGGDIRRMAKALGVGEAYLRNFEALASLDAEILDVVPDLRKLKKQDGKLIKPLWANPKSKARLQAEVSAIKAEQQNVLEIGLVQAITTEAVVKRLIRSSQQKKKGSETVGLGRIGSKDVVAEVNARSISLKVPRGSGFDADAFLGDLKKLIASHGDR